MTSMSSILSLLSLSCLSGMYFFLWSLLLQSAAVQEQTSSSIIAIGQSQNQCGLLGEKGSGKSDSYLAAVVVVVEGSVVVVAVSRKEKSKAGMVDASR